MPSFSEQTTGIAQERANGFVTAAKTANYTVLAADAPLSADEIIFNGNTNVTVGVTATIPPNSTLPYAIGQSLVFLQGVTGTTVITAGAGVTLVGASATVAASTGRTAVQIVKDTWFLY